MTTSDFITLGEKYGYKIKYFGSSFYWLMPGDSCHFFAWYQVKSSNVYIVDDFEYSEGRICGLKTVCVTDEDFEDKIKRAIEKYKLAVLEGKKEQILMDF